MAKTAPPDEVLSAFVGVLNATVKEYEAGLVPVLRGSFLVRHWLGDEARPAADIDLECFAGPNPERPNDEFDDDETFEPEEGRYGPYGEYESLVDYGKAMCRYAANASHYRLHRENRESAVLFQEADPPAGGVSLWIYGTPGERYYAGWTVNETGRSGLLQIDIASSGYPLSDIATTTIEVDLDGATVACPAYTPETLLAAKVSWLLRSLTRDDGGSIVWKGEPKDLFDAHLILTRLELDARAFQRSLLAIGTQDQLDWTNLAVLMTAGHALNDADFPNWASFHKAHKKVVTAGPSEMLRATTEGLAPLLGDFYRADEMPFLRTLNANPADELARLVYADWLDDHGHAARAALVRAWARFEFHTAELTEDARDQLGDDLEEALNTAPGPWVCLLFGTPGRLAALRDRLAAA